MAQDFAKKKPQAGKPRAKTTKAKPVKRKANTRKAPTQKKKPPFWAWLFVGVALMGFAYFLTQLNSASTPKKSSPAPEEKVSSKEKPESQVRFDFYEILKGHEVEVDDKVIAHTPKESNIIYWLQAASFKSSHDADQLRVKLLLQNLNASIESSTNEQSQTWHRVMVGPFSSRSKLAKARSILASNEINGIVIKRKAQP